VTLSVVSLLSNYQAVAGQKEHRVRSCSHRAYFQEWSSEQLLCQRTGTGGGLFSALVSHPYIRYLPMDRDIFFAWKHPFTEELPTRFEAPHQMPHFSSIQTPSLGPLLKHTVPVCEYRPLSREHPLYIWLSCDRQSITMVYIACLERLPNLTQVATLAQIRFRVRNRSC
jgi:hypothetical protein